MIGLLALVALWACRPSAALSVRDAVILDISESMCAVNLFTVFPLYFKFCAQDGISFSSRLCGECVCIYIDRHMKILAIGRVRL